MGLAKAASVATAGNLLLTFSEAVQHGPGGDLVLSPNPAGSASFGASLVSGAVPAKA